MSNREIDTIIVKYLADKSTEKELAFLNEWLKQSENEEYFNAFVEMNFLLNTKQKFDKEKSLAETMRTLKLEEDRWLNKAFKYAAIFVGFIGMAYFFIIQINESPSNYSKIGATQEIILELESGKTVRLETTESQKVIKANGKTIGVHNARRIDYQDVVGASEEKLVYNKLIVPYGKTYQVVLSDGTKVHINSGSTLRYPVRFLKNQERLVFVDGEAFFEVTSNKENPFVVNAKEMNIRVTGTKFNVSNYQEDLEVKTVLIEGIVDVSEENKSETKRIAPGELAAWNKSNQKLTVKEVDTSLYTDWIKGILVFKHIKFRDMAVKLERKYNVIIKTENAELNERVFTGRFEDATLVQVLETLKRSYHIHYTIQGNKVIIT
ncbi:FecR family protein [Flavicella sediminum]|uniref:FecR family protein n=1 Tax=Flavicella sediminum TaxID=2585141 RepID=UPI001121BC54|nr:FecR domain-containing protein [Flavicella sediminum]